MYSEIVKKYFENPTNLGTIENVDAIGIIENEICSDIIKIYIKADEQNKNIIEDAKFEAKGCPPVIASCCVVTEMIKNMEIEKAKTLTAKKIINKLNGLPKEKEHCAELVIKTLRKAIENINWKRALRLFSTL
mgnify:CR=1 FL=1